MRHDLGIRASVAAAVVVAFGGMAAAANAATKTSDYHPNPQARSFAGGAGGWTANAVYEGTLCIPALTCPLAGAKLAMTGAATKLAALVVVPPGVVTLSGPVVTPVGAVA